MLLRFKESCYPDLCVNTDYIVCVSKGRHRQTIDMVISGGPLPSTYVMRGAENVLTFGWSSEMERDEAFDKILQVMNCTVLG